MNTSKNIIVKTSKIECTGLGDKKNEHPKVYLTINYEVNEVICPYCRQHFIMQT